MAQRSFVGVAFRIADDSTYDVIYLRPFNCRATDSTLRTHGSVGLWVGDDSNGDFANLRLNFLTRKNGSAPGG